MCFEPSINYWLSVSLAHHPLTKDYEKNVDKESLPIYRFFIFDTILINSWAQANIPLAEEAKALISNFRLTRFQISPFCL